MNKPIDSDDLIKLKNRETELLRRLERLKASMNQTGEIDTLVFKSKMMREVQDELRRLLETLAGGGPETPSE